MSEVSRVFQLLYDDVDDDVLPVFDYFAENYITGKPGKGRRKGVPPRYPPALWNHRDAALDGSHKTNNISEGWHNRFQCVVGHCQIVIATEPNFDLKE